MKVKELKTENFEELLKETKPVLVDMYATWCGPCQMQGPIVEELASENDNIIVGKLDVDENPEIAVKYGVMSIPILLVIKNGEVTKQFVGLTSKEDLLAELK